MKFQEISELCKKIKENISKVIIGKNEVLDVMMVSIIAGGHILLEDVPGTGKTVVAKSLAKSIDGNFKRIQFTPDLLPSDITGINYYNQKLGEFTFRQGPIFTNILLADEINRATPRTQSALLESMEEKQVSVEGETYMLDKPFLVIATQNPVETQGTFPLPEAQLDRFFVKLKMGYPSLEEGKQILKRFMDKNPMESIVAVCSKEEIIEAANSYQSVHVSDDIMEYMIKIVQATTNSDNILLGVSPRGSLALLKACQIYAAMNGREYVIPDDVKHMCPFVLAHRIIIRDSLSLRGTNSSKILMDIVNSVEAPVENWTKSN
ncbi:MoxR family ATPase [Clostridium sp. 19966]|uniref:AAA family ATPase n=1 Tax=Clostridium sp. 19966 TaxID=2768166 RepID=UPI0028DFF7F2|nr:MoxR family ATPase [Clostridium sp. 19966]MDT8718530.1 MoxR family ATPase [Clostridium sp. 19966]